MGVGGLTGIFVTITTNKLPRSGIHICTTQNPPRATLENAHKFAEFLPVFPLTHLRKLFLRISPPIEKYFTYFSTKVLHSLKTHI